MQRGWVLISLALLLVPETHEARERDPAAAETGHRGSTRAEPGFRQRAGRRAEAVVSAGPRGYLTTPAELGAVRQKAEAGLEPYRSAVTEVLRWAQERWEFSLQSVETCPSADEPPWNDDRGGTRVLYAKALAYHLAGDGAYAEDVSLVLERIMTEVVTISTADLQCQLNFGWGAPELVASADLIEDYWRSRECSGPASTVHGDPTVRRGPCKELFQNWLAKNPYYVVSGAATRLTNNWGAAATNATQHIADYLWDRPAVTLVHRNPPQVNGGNDFRFTPARAYSFVRRLTLQRMGMHQVGWTAHGCDNLSGPSHSPLWPAVKSGITENGIVSEDARRDEFCNVPAYDGTYQNYPELHLGNQIQQCELMLRRGDASCYDNVEHGESPDYAYLGPDGTWKKTHLRAGRGSLERALNAIIVDAGAEWRRSGALRVAYRYYSRRGGAAGKDLSSWAARFGAVKCYQDVCFGTLTHGFHEGESPTPPPSVPPPSSTRRRRGRSR